MRTLAITYQSYLHRLAAALALLLALCLFLYGFFLLETVAHAAGREEAETQIETLSTTVSELEAQYLLADEAITPERATALGFVPGPAPSLVAASAPLQPLSLR